MEFNLFHGDCIEEMMRIPSQSVDSVICDPPYGTTACKWDTIIPLDSMWAEIRRIVKGNGAIVMTAAQPFSSILVSSNISSFRHSWVWDKGVGSNFAQAKRVPLKCHEDVLVFSMGNKNPPYYPQMKTRDKPMPMGGNSGKRGTGAYDLRGPAVEAKLANGKIYTEAYPKSVLPISPRSDPSRGLHPTQKPVALMEYLIRTYTEKGETVLDFTMGSGTTGVAAANEGRSFIGVEKELEYFEIARGRIEEAYIDPELEHLI